MPPKKKPVKRRKSKQPLQKQSQKQVVNIKIGDSVKKRKSKPRTARKKIASDGILSAVQVLGSNLNMLSSDTSRLNTLENLITSLINNQKAPARVQTINQTPAQAEQTQAKLLDKPPKVPAPQRSSSMPVFSNPLPDETVLPPIIQSPVLTQLERLVSEEKDFLEDRDLDDLYTNIRDAPSSSKETFTSPQEEFRFYDEARINYLSSQAEDLPETLIPPPRKERKDKGIPRGQNITSVRNKLADDFAEKQAKIRGIRGLLDRY